MNRKLKAIALALTAIFSMSALAASSAHANLTSSSSHTILHGVQQNSMVYSAGEGFGGVSCSTVTFSGTGVGTEVESMVLTPVVASCKDTFGRTIHVEQNFTSTITNDGSSHATGESVLKATSGGSVVCTTTMKTQKNDGSESIVENRGGTEGITVNLKVMDSISTTSGGFFNCGISNGEHKAGTANGTGLVKGQDTSGNPVSISID